MMMMSLINKTFAQKIFFFGAFTFLLSLLLSQVDSKKTTTTDFLFDERDDSKQPAGDSGRCWANANSGLLEKPQWWAEGALLDRGKYWYECRGGKLVPKGCLDNHGNRVEMDRSFTSYGYVLQCSLSLESASAAEKAGGTLVYKHVGCSLDNGEGRSFKFGESWLSPDGKHWFECVQEGQNAKVRLAGCMAHDNTTKLRIGERADFGAYFYECQEKAGGGVQLCPVGCIIGNRRYKTGEEWQDGDFLFYCKRSGGTCEQKCVGCVFKEKNVFDGDRFHQNGSVFQCEIRPQKHSLKPVACLDKTGIERVLGCTWHEADGTMKVEQTCQIRKGRATVVTVGCVFVHEGYKILVLRPNTFTFWKKSEDDLEPLGVACRRKAEGGGQRGGSSTLKTFKMDKFDEETVGLTMDSDPHA